ncbi:beta-1,3-glucosyltransferase isoform X2 [Tachypleus tridentatus]
MHPPVIHMTAHDWPEVMGSWTVFPLLSRLSNIHKHNSSWILFCEDITSVDLEKLVALLEKYNSSKPYFIGHGLMDNEPTIIHHFDTVERNSPFLYPAFNTGFVISTSLLKKIAVRWRKAPHHDFSIDAKHELAKFIWNEGKGYRLKSLPEFCLLKTTKDCVTWISASSCNRSSLSVTDVFFAVKTCEKFHDDRVQVVRDTWAKGVVHMKFFSNKNDPAIPTYDLGVPNTPHGHCAKTMAILSYLFNDGLTSNYKWIVIADDDTLLSVSRLLQLLRCYDHTEPVAVGERYGYNVASGDGYDYITGGGGMVFSLPAVKKIVNSPVCDCPTDDAPDDMILGQCLQFLNIPVTHTSQFHQARPSDYSVEYLSFLPPVSFHKHWMIDPRAVYYQWLHDENQHSKSHDEL